MSKVVNFFNSCMRHPSTLTRLSDAAKHCKKGFVYSIDNREGLTYANLQFNKKHGYILNVFDKGRVQIEKHVFEKNLLKGDKLR